jgi:drug/metabolite transporter (DMT)-like permease
MTSPSSSAKPPAVWVAAAFLYVYFAWGATYLALHFALATLPPFLLSGARFVLAGLTLLGLVRLFHRGEFQWGSAREWRDATIVGTLLIGGGNGSLSWAQQYVTTSTAALIFGSLPLFIILFDWLRPGGIAPSARTGLGLALGFIGLCILIKPNPGAPDTRMEIWGKLALVFAACSWSAGAIYSRQVHARGSAVLPMARQMISGGAVLLAISLPHGDWSHFSLGHVTVKSWLGFGYLFFFGSLLGFTAYAWLMRVSTPDRVATISYVNLVIAVFLGWTLGGDVLTPRVLFGAAIIIGSVVIVLKKKAVRDAVDAAPTEA